MITAVTIINKDVYTADTMYTSRPGITAINVVINMAYFLILSHKIHFLHHHF